MRESGLGVGRDRWELVRGAACNPRMRGPVDGGGWAVGEWPVSGGHRT